MRISEGVSVGLNVALGFFVVGFASIALAAAVFLVLSVIAPFPH